MTDLDAVPPQGAPVLERWAVRALLVDDLGSVLLFRGVDPGEPERGWWWFTPGGGIEPGESELVALQREIREETGIALDPELVGSAVWIRDTRFAFAGEWYHQREKFFLIRVHEHAVDTSGFTPLEAASVFGHRWWNLDELAASQDPVYPVRLAQELSRLLGDGPPAQPYVVD